MSDARPDFTRSILRVINKSAEVDFANPFLPQADLSNSTGTAYFISKHVLVTCYHVVANTQELFLERDDESEGVTNSVKAKLLYICPNIDLALIYHGKMEGEPLQVAADIIIRKEDTLVGRGFPAGATTLHANKGVVSRYEDELIVVDTPQNPGNSGGPMFDENNVVVATCNAGIPSLNNMSFGIPSPFVHQAVSEYLTLRTGNPVQWEHNWASFRPNLLDAEAARQVAEKAKPVLALRPCEDFSMQRGNRTLLASRKSSRGGAMVMKLLKGGPSDRAGLKQGDLVVSVNNKRLSPDGLVLGFPGKGQSAKLKTYLLSLRPGDPLDIQVLPKGTMKLRTVNSKATSALDRKVTAVFTEVDEIDYEVFAGLVFENLALNHADLPMRSNIEFKTAMQFENLDSPRLIVVNVLPKSFFECKKTVKAGQLVSSVNGIKVNSLKQLRRALDAIIRNDEEEFFIFELATGGEAVIHKVTVAKQDPAIRKRKGLKQSKLMAMLEQRVEGLEFDVDDDCANVDD